MNDRKSLRLATRINQIKPSPTMSVMAEAMRLRAEGVDIIDFSAGQPDFPTPEYVKQAGIKAIEENHTRYTPNQGIPELRAAVAERYRVDYGLEFDDKEVIITSGGKHALLNLMLALVESGDEVVIPTPYWMTFSEQVRLAGGKPILVPTSELDGFRVTASLIAPSLTERTRLLLINSPANPTGAIVSEKDLLSLGKLLKERDAFFLWDDTYARLMPDPSSCSAYAWVQKELEGRFLIAGTASKAFAMTGWRIGWALGPKPVIEASGALQSHMTSNASSISQHAAITAISECQDSVSEMLKEYEWRADRLRKGLIKIPGISCNKPGGGFYLFPNVSNLLFTNETTTDLATTLLTEERVAVVPGLAFGLDGHIRVSFACSREDIEEGLKRLHSFFMDRSLQ